MTATSHPEFGANTEALEVSKAFADQVRGKTIIVTGVNRAGLGFTAAEAFASQSPAHVIITGRNPEKLQESVNALKSSYPDVDYRMLKMDLGSQVSVREAADEVLGWADVPTVDIIVNNAAVMVLPELTKSPEGIEMQFATNHIGHFLFTSLIMPKLIKASQQNRKGATRVVNVSAMSPKFARMRWSDLGFEKINTTLPEEEQPIYSLHKAWAAKDPENMSYIPLEGYNQSKLANLLYAIEIGNRMYEKYGILGFALHPGVIYTELARNASQPTLDAVKGMADEGMITYKTLGAGSSTALVAALDPALGKSEARGNQENYGAYLVDCQINDQYFPENGSNANADRIWRVSEEMVNQKFAW